MTASLKTILAMKISNHLISELARFNQSVNSPHKYGLFVVTDASKKAA
jgi:hypothetical protein